MKTIIAGGRDYNFSVDDVFLMNILRGYLPITEVVSGGASGADREGEHLANDNNIDCTIFPAEWDKHGKAAGHIRNEVMAQYADAVILFTGGKGTENMYKNAIKYGLKIIDLRK